MRTPRTALFALLVAFAALVVAGCGGGEVDADEVPGAAPALSVPSDSDIGSGDSASSDSNSSTDDSSSSDTSDDTSDSGTSGTGTTGTGSTGTGTTGGTTTPSTSGTTGGTGTGTGDHDAVDRRRRHDRHPAGGRLGAGAVRELLRAERRRLLRPDSRAERGFVRQAQGPPGRYRTSAVRPKVLLPCQSPLVPERMSHMRRCAASPRRPWSRARPRPCSTRSSAS